MLWLLFQFFAVADGLCDALLYGCLGADSFKWNEHCPLVTRRVLAILAALGAAADTLLVDGGHVWGWPVWLLWLLWEVAAVALSFSLFHNEAYNFGRLWLQVQDFQEARRQFRFNYQSPTTSARFDFDGTARWVMAGAAVVWLFLGFFLLARLD